MSKSSEHTLKWEKILGVGGIVMSTWAFLCIFKPSMLKRHCPGKSSLTRKKICAKKWLQKKTKKYVKPNPPSHFSMQVMTKRPFQIFPWPNNACFSCGIGCIPGFISISIWESPLQPSKWEIPIWLDDFGDRVCF